MSYSDVLDLSKLPWLPLVDKSIFPSEPAIYFCVDINDVVQYIGRSINPRKRWINHHRYKQLLAIGKIRVCYLFVESTSLLSKVETAMILLFQPKLNYTNTPSFTAVKKKVEKPRLQIKQKTRREKVYLSYYFHHSFTSVYKKLA